MQSPYFALLRAVRVFLTLCVLLPCPLISGGCPLTSGACPLTSGACPLTSGGVSSHLCVCSALCGLQCREASSRCVAGHDGQDAAHHTSPAHSWIQASGAATAHVCILPHQRMTSCRDFSWLSCAVYVSNMECSLLMQLVFVCVRAVACVCVCVCVCVSFPHPSLLSLSLCREGTDMDSLLERQADTIRYLQQHNATLANRILLLQQERTSH